MANPEFRSVSSIVAVPSSGNGSATVSLPAGTVNGDYVFIVCLTRDGTPAANVAPSAGHGFGSPLLAFATTLYFSGYRIFGKVAASEPSTYTVTESALDKTGVAFAITYSNPGGTPINASANSSELSGTTSPSIPTLSTTSTGKLIGLCLETFARNTTLTAAGSMTRRQFQANADLSFAWVDEDIATTGSISGRTVSSSVSGNFRVAGILLTGSAGGPSRHAVERGRSVARGILRGV